MLRPAVLLFVGSIVLAPAGASALPTAPIGSPASEVSKVGYFCGPGYHLGYGRRYCWPNGVNFHPGYARPCPPGYHIGRQGRYCWRD